MKPLSILYYFLNNKRKIIPVCLSICLGVMFFYFLFLAGIQSDESGTGTYIKPFEYISIISSDENIPTNIVNKIKINKDIQRIVPMNQFPHINITRAVGNGSAGIMFVRVKDISYMMNSMNLKLIEGKLPTTKEEIILHKSIAANKKLKVGDTYSDNNEIQEKFKVVGIFSGSSILGFVPAEIKGESVENWLEDDLLVMPVLGKMDELNSFLDTLPSSKGLVIYTLSKAKEEVAVSNKNLRVVMYLLVFIVITVLCITLSNTSIMHFYQRRSEFGVLTAIGYTRWEIVKKVWLEAVLIGSISFLLGIALSMLCASAFNVLYWNPIGDSVHLWSLKGFLVTATIPLFVTIFSVKPILKLLKKEDLINVIEGI